MKILNPTEITSAYGQVYLGIRASSGTEEREIPLGVLFSLGLLPHHFKVDFVYEGGRVYFKPTEDQLGDARYGRFHVAEGLRGHLPPGAINGLLELKLSAAFLEGELFVGLDESGVKDAMTTFAVHKDGKRPYISHESIPVPEGCVQIRERSSVSATFFYKLKIHLAKEFFGRWYKNGEFRQDSLDQARFIL